MLALMLTFLKAKCVKLPEPHQDALRLLLVAIQTHVTSLGEPTLSDTRRRLSTFRRFSVGRLFQVILQCEEVSETLKLTLKKLLMSARREVYSLDDDI